MEYPFVLGTAGHIDHGKTSLVKALTGVDCDRLEEEKRRGITIELGFASLRLASGKTVSIIDVPGHERFIRQMAAGASGMDAAMLVIAATEGVMPQTKEHLDILNLLGVRCGLVALTKKDLVDGETLEIAASEVRELVRGTCLSDAAIIPVSSASGEGVSQILAEIESLTDKVPPRKGFGAFFLPIDRVFSKKGFGSVVTGTACQGTIGEGDEVEIMPSRAAGRVRSLQTHGTKAASVQPGHRVAINISGVSHDEMERGDAVCAKGAFIPADCISAWLDVLPSAHEGIAHWQRVRLHAGTVDVVARISLLRLNTDEKKRVYPPGSGGPVQLLPESNITVAAGQRFVIRLYSPLVTIGGGRIMLPNALLARSRTERENKAQTLSALASDFGPAFFLAALIHDRGIVSAQGLHELSQMDKASFAEVLKELSRPAAYNVMEFGKARLFISATAFDAIALAARRILEKFHAEYPELAGLDAEKLYASLGAVKNAGKIAAGDFKDLAGILVEKNIAAHVMIQGKTCYRSVDFRHGPDDKFMALVGRVRDAVALAGFNLLTLPELEGKLDINPADIKRAAAYLREQEDMRVIEGGFFFSSQMRDKLLSVLASMPEDITVASLRDSTGASRKYAIPMLEFLDSQGLTQRVGDKRVIVSREPAS
ncbi:MAG: selenocysteine-specific translation elongation factor [Treponema sp.]|nr:selenocysteine-specific translation elongation factor [Treponema sp.]